MKNSSYIYKELAGITPFLAEQEKVNVFLVPENYFSQFEIQILKRIKDVTTADLSASETQILSVPDGYFENLAGNILQKIKQFDNAEANHELKQLSPLLYSAKNKNVFTSPDKYFENFADNILNVVKPSAKVVVMNKKRSIVWNMASAAMVAGIMAVSALWVNNNSSQQTSLVNDKNISLNIKDALQYKNEQQVDQGIANLSDGDIIKYLETTGSTADDEALASGLQEKDLPDEQDYLTNENTLQNFLSPTKSQNKQNL